jgi:hypothetical protein
MTNLMLIIRFIDILIHIQFKMYFLVIGLMRLLVGILTIKYIS